MLIKEYRIILPITLEEYRIAHLYMVAKKSREESQGPESSGVEILVNEPYSDGPGGSGQFTHKLYHFGSYLPSCLRSLMRVTSKVDERSWNAYPYTKSTYTWPRMEKFSIEIETIYTDDRSPQDNIFQLSEEQLNSRVVDNIDIVNDIIDCDYKQEEDPKLYVSQKTGRGPLSESWIQDISSSNQSNSEEGAKSFMCAYKLCKVEFKYRFVQSKAENWIHDNVIRKNVLQGNRQIWAWQDEWTGLTIDDIRAIEVETQALLSERMASMEDVDGGQRGDEIAVANFGFSDIDCLELLPHDDDDSNVAEDADSNPVDLNLKNHADVEENAENCPGCDLVAAMNKDKMVSLCNEPPESNDIPGFHTEGDIRSNSCEGEI